MFIKLTTSRSDDGKSASFIHVNSECIMAMRRVYSKGQTEVELTTGSYKFVLETPEEIADIIAGRFKWFGNQAKENTSADNETHTGPHCGPDYCEIG